MSAMTVSGQRRTRALRHTKPCPLDGEVMDLHATPTFFVGGARHHGPYDATTLNPGARRVTSSVAARSRLIAHSSALALYLNQRFRLIFDIRLAELSVDDACK